MIPGFVGLPAEGVAQRVDREGGLVERPHAHHPGPEQAAEPGSEGAGHGEAHAERNQQSQHRPKQEGARDEDEIRVGQQVGRVALVGAALVMHEEPAHMRVPEPLDASDEAFAVVDVRRVRVARLVRVGVVAPVIGDPGDERPLDRHRAEDRQGDLEGAPALERAMSEETMEAHRHAQAGQHVADDEHPEVQEVERLAPRPYTEDDGQEEGKAHDEPGDDPVPGLVLAGLDFDLGGHASA